MAVALVWVDNGRVTPRVRDLIADVKVAAKLPAGSLRVMQGSYSGGVRASAGTHDGGGAFDVSIRGLTKRQQLKVVAEFRRRNVCFWLRTPEYGWPASAGGPHGHGIVRDARGLSSGARAQVAAYDRGQNGLARGRPDPHARPKQYPVEVVRKQVKAASRPPSKPGPRLQHPGTMRKTVKYQTRDTTAVTVVGGRWWTTAAIVLPEGGVYTLIFKVRMPQGSGAGQADLVRYNWPGKPKWDSTGRARVAPAVRKAGIWYQWRTPIEGRVLSGGGTVSFRILMPPGVHRMRFAVRATRVK